MRRGLVVAVCSVLAGTAARPASADPRTDLEKAHNAYAAHKYEDAEARLRALLDAKTGTLKDPDNVADARMYLAATLIAEKKHEEVAELLESLIRDRPDYQPDPLRVSLEAMDAFTDARRRLQDELAAKAAEKVRKAQEEKAKLLAEQQKQALRLAMLEKLAGTEVVVERHSRWLAMVPFGVGQFQNGQTAEGWLFLAGEGLLAAGSVVGAGFTYYYAQTAYAAQQRGDGATASAYESGAKWAAITDDLLVGGLVLAAAAGIIHAQATFVPESVETRKRELPPVSITPVIGPGGVGLVGRF